ncbi:glycosyl transferase group 1 [[Leptolyngbya] sp. PCC 7376]|uniref:glycosyltransferase n=1 Tax=[Leptolyngbya] sp. PCC 7376 TaxID=111781 RepID=UPI00029ECA21|nr:glycosyltransferase [[Leptolyngbya] sp. PCC 7376]AFY37403.1 glycosyl transferase group 1 [[Leptolyngbya] sp. PCC 7376]
MKVLFLASYFPKPDNPLMGTWALCQAQAFVRQGVDLKVLSFTSWVPKALARSSGARAYANCPTAHTWEGDVHVEYPRWGYYPINPIKSWSYSNPEPYLHFAFQTAKKRLIAEIESFNPDVIFCHHSVPNAWMVAQLPEKYRRPMFVLEHDFEEIADCNHLPKRHTAYKTALSATTALLAVSKPMEKDMRRLFPEQHIFTHHNGINIEPVPENLERSPELQDKFVFLACALFAERKGVPLLVRAFGAIADQYPDSILRIIGGGPEEELIKETVQLLKLENRVQLIGKQPHNVVLQEMHLADCFALVGWNEPFATVYLEAMAAGKPIICCSDGGITDVIEHEQEALIIPPKDESATIQALKLMLDNPDKVTTMGHNAKHLIESSLTWDVKTKELLNHFETVPTSQ